MSRFSTLNAVAALTVLEFAAACASRETAPRAAAPAAEPTAAAEQAPPPSVVAADGFQAEVRPILARRCTPCHEPGGRMYARLPFDDAETVRSNREGILRRLNGDDTAALERWLAGS